MESKIPDHIHILIPEQKFCKVSRKLGEAFRRSCGRTLIYGHSKSKEAITCQNNPIQNADLHNRANEHAKFEGNRMRHLEGVANTSFLYGNAKSR